MPDIPTIDGQPVLIAVVMDGDDCLVPLMYGADGVTYQDTLKGLGRMMGSVLVGLTEQNPQEDQVVLLDHVMSLVEEGCLATVTAVTE